jgi:hypothetical protein
MDLRRLLATVGLTCVGFVVAGAFLIVQRLQGLKTDIHSLEEKSQLVETLIRNQLEGIDKTLERLQSQREMTRPPHAEVSTGNQDAKTTHEEVSRAPESEDAYSPKVNGRKIVEELGSDGLRVAKTVGSWSLEEFSNFLREKTGIELDISDKYNEEAVSVLRGKYSTQSKLLEFEQHLVLLRARKDLEEKGLFEEGPSGNAFPPAKADAKHLVTYVGTMDNKSQMQRRFRISAEDYPEILKRDEDLKKAFAQLLEDVGAFLAGHETSK